MREDGGGGGGGGESAAMAPTSGTTAFWGVVAMRKAYWRLMSGMVGSEREW